MKRVILYGDLAEKFGKEHRFDVATVAEAIRALRANFAEFEIYMCRAHVSGVGFKVFAGGQSLYLDEITKPMRETDIIRIVPVILGSGADLKIVLGAALIAVGVIFAPFSAGFTTGLISAGVGLVIGGVAQLLTPVPSVDQLQQGTSKQSYIFNGPVNKSNQGSAIPVGYGRMFVGSTVVSAEITTADV